MVICDWCYEKLDFNSAMDINLSCLFYVPRVTLCRGCTQTLSDLVSMAIRNGKKNLIESVPSLTPEQRQQVAAYIATLKQ